MESRRIGVSERQLAEFCRRWSISEMAVFGSALRDDFGPQSDLDIMITREPTARWSLLDHVRMKRELSQLAGREVDLFTRRAVERSSNEIRRQAILATAEAVYAAG